MFADQCKRRKKNDAEPPPLWRISLDQVLRMVADEHPETLVRMVARDSKLRDLMTEELLRKQHPAAQLGDSDLIEVFRISVNVDNCPKIYPEHHDEFFMKVGDLPWRLRMAIKHEYDMNAGLLSQPDPDFGRFPSHGELYFSKDGRIVFELPLHKKGLVKAGWIEDAYISIVKGFVEEHNVPSWEDVQGAKWDDMDIQDQFPHVIDNTLEEDAYTLQLNANEELLRKKVRRDIRVAFMLKNIVPSTATEGQKEVIPIKQAWVRKPKVRVWVPFVYYATQEQS